MGETPIYGLPWPELTDPADVPLAIRNTSETTEPILANFQEQITGSVGALSKLGHTELGADAGLIDFTAIPQTYSNLLILAHLRSTAPGLTTEAGMRFNAGATNYWTHMINANNNAVAGASGINQILASIGTIPAAGATTPGYFGGVAVFVFGYTKTTKSKAWASLGFTLADWALPSGMWNYVRGGYWGESAVTSLQIFQSGAGLLRAGSMATLYGLRGA